MTAIKFAGVSPHPPIIVHEIGRGRERETQRTIDALEQLAAEMAAHRPETLVLMATHGPLNPGAFFLLNAASTEGDFARWGAPQVRLQFQGDPETAAAIEGEAAAAGLPLDVADRWDSGLDWSCTVPLYYLRCGLQDARLVAMNIAFLSPQQHFQFGRAVRRAVDRIGRRAVIIASADLSHRLSNDGPYGYDPAGPEFDRRIQEALANWDVDAILGMELAFREAAGDDAIPSLSFLMGALDGLPVQPRILSYEGPFGVGYMVAAIDILDDDPHVRAELVEARAAVPAEPAVQEPEPIVEAAAGPSHPLVRLARDAVHAYVLRGQALDPDPPDDPPDDPPVGSPSPALGPGLPLRAGCFVSLKTGDGALRGCIGSVEPIAPTLAEEVVRNAIHSASRDLRFLPVTPQELPHLVYSVDVLSPPEPIDGLHQLDPRRYGVIVQNADSGRRGLLLPDIEGVDTPQQQVAIAMSKALIEPDEPVSLWRFEVRRLT
ncbi:MAG: AmmeMemoRadiSam system protein A [Chloroflexi bacterium]|nr:AmmeMemoRadiSam system protein A [Chloroflexota bacterium]